MFFNLVFFLFLKHGSIWLVGGKKSSVSFGMHALGKLLVRGTFRDFVFPCNQRGSYPEGFNHNIAVAINGANNPMYLQLFFLLYFPLLFSFATSRYINHRSPAASIINIAFNIRKFDLLKNVIAKAYLSYQLHG